MKRYFKHDAESDLGEGVFYIEFTDSWPSRQVEVYADQWKWGDEAHLENLADQPIEVLELGPEHEIQPDEFEEVWREALRRSPRRS